MIIVTGGAGFIGSNLVRGLNKRGHSDILIVDDLTDGSKHKNLNRLNFSDYIDHSEFLEKFDKIGVDMVFHQGACADTTETNGKFMMNMNYAYSKRLLELCTRDKVKFIYASSASVYGNGDCGFREELKCEYPLNVYAFSKYQFDRYVASIWHHLKDQVVGLRYFNVYGPQENHKGKMASVAYHMFRGIKNGEPMRLFEGSENFKRDFIHVDDVVNVNLFFFDRPKLSGVYNCGTGRAESFTTIAKTMQSAYPDSRLEIIPFPKELENKYQKFTQADLENLRRVGYAEQFMDLATGVRKYIDVLEKGGGYHL